MNFTSARLVEQVIWDMRSADTPRGANRAMIDRLFSGFPPWTPDEQEEARINTNVNFLDAPKLAADARRSYYNAFLKPEVFFTLKLDAGPPAQRGSWSALVTQAINGVLKNSLPYFETVRSQIAATVLHGKGPVTWSDRMGWRPSAVDLPDLLLPSNTLLSLENLDHFAIFKSYTATELHGMVERKNVDPAWNLALARRAIKWCLERDTGNASGIVELSAEKMQEQIQQDGGYYGSDSSPTIDCWDFYFKSDQGGKSGWRRRMVLETPTAGEAGTMPSQTRMGTEHDEWLYNGGERIYAENIPEILHFQFGDLSAKSPFKYHSVRSLGWLIYAVCHLQNRLRCKINDATFENLLNYFRVANPDDVDRLTKIDLHNFGVVPEGVEFVKQQDRWQVNHVLVQTTMTDNRQQMNEAAAQFREGRDTNSSKERTATEIMAEVNAANALVGTMLLLAYTYQKGQYLEIVRRFFLPNSSDKDVVAFREKVLRQGVPEQVLDLKYWHLSPERVLGSGNKMLQIAMADQLMKVRGMLDPEAQREVLRLYVEANSDDAGLGQRWVPPAPEPVTGTQHDAQLMLGTLMMGVTVPPRPGQDAGQMAQALLIGGTEIAKRINSTTGLPTAAEFVGLTNVVATAEAYVARLGQDPTQADVAKQVQAHLTQLMELLREWGEKLQEAENQPPAGSGAEGEAGKQEARVIEAQSKAQLAEAAAQQKLQQRDAQFQLKQQQADEKHTSQLRQTLKASAVSTAVADAKAASEIRNKRKTTPKESPKP